MCGSRTFWIFGTGFVLCWFQAGCNSAHPEAPALGTAYAGPAILKLHREIDSKSPVVASVPHGETLVIVGQRRRWYKVRTPAGLEGWTSDRELLDTAQMRRLRGLAKETAGMPSQGVATTFSDLNVHMEPSRVSPSFVQIKQHEKVDVIAHRVAPRTAEAPRHELLPPKPKPEKKAGKEKASKLPPPPVPAPPQPPADWLELSRNPDLPATSAPPQNAPPVKTDDWTLIRTRDGESGWVLSSALYLEIPDEVAQYAEGHRITSYFSLGKIQDGDLKKDIWLWTTSEQLGEDYDFDSYRVFVWSIRRHRYETGYIQRRERGFFPVLAKTGEFAVCLEQDDGTRMRRQYVMMGNLVHPAGSAPCARTAADQAVETPAPASLAVQTTAPGAKQGLLARWKQKMKSIFSK